MAKLNENMVHLNYYKYGREKSYLSREIMNDIKLDNTY